MNEHQALAEIGIVNLTDTQFDCFFNLPLISCASCLTIFVTWIDEGFYDFCNIPFALKVKMSKSDSTSIVQGIKETWSGSTNDLLCEVKKLIDILRHSEGDIVMNVSSNSQVSSYALSVLYITIYYSQKSVINYLADYHLLDVDEELAKRIPRTVLLQNYVDFRQALRR